MISTSSFSRDANQVPITTLGLTATKSITYAAATTGAQGASTLFTVTGDVAVRVFAKCTTDLTGANATLEVGIAGNTAALIAQTTGTTIDLGEIWLDTSPATVEALPAQQILVGSTNIIQTIATADVTAGVLTYYVLWCPISSDGNVVAA
jgi:hypothetical protein